MKYQYQKLKRASQSATIISFSLCKADSRPVPWEKGEQL